LPPASELPIVELPIQPPSGPRPARRPGPALDVGPLADPWAARRSGALVLGLLSLYLLLKPFYVLPSGLPQPGDALVVLLAGALLVRRRVALDADSAQLIFWASAFALYSVAVNLHWWFRMGERGFLLSALFYPFNLVVMLACVRLRSEFGDRLLRTVAYTVAASLLVEVIVSLVVSSPPESRPVLSFNNTNQLAHWSVLSACIFFLCASQTPIRWSLQLFVFGAASYLTLLSASKAGVAALGPLCLAAFLRRPAALVLIGVAGLGLALSPAGPSLFDPVSNRIEHLESDDTVEARGYDWIWRHPHHLLFGAGEGAYHRFRPSWQPQVEMHSSPATLLFAYGVIGSVAFALLLVRFVRNAGLQRALFLVPPLIYGVAHQGLRFSLLWILLGLAGGARVDPGGRPGGALVPLPETPERGESPR
jgi:hypothetical protein